MKIILAFPCDVGCYRGGWFPATKSLLVFVELKFTIWYIQKLWDVDLVANFIRELAVYVRRFIVFFGTESLGDLVREETSLC